MPWTFLLIAGLFEIAWAVGLKYADGFTRLTPSVLTLGSMALSAVMLSLSARTLPIGTAYAIWTGIGTVGSCVLGIYLFGEAANLLRIVFIALIVTGAVGLRLTSP
jgi:quaternary ammonium compound-resistance protein SugE